MAGFSSGYSLLGIVVHTGPTHCTMGCGCGGGGGGGT